MLTLAMILGMFVGYEGYDNGKLYIGTYTPTCEYGWVITDSEIYLDTIYEKKYILPLDNERIYVYNVDITNNTY